MSRTTIIEEGRFDSKDASKRLMNEERAFIPTRLAQPSPWRPSKHAKGRLNAKRKRKQEKK